MQHGRPYMDSSDSYDAACWLDRFLAGGAPLIIYADVTNVDYWMRLGTSARRRGCEDCHT